MELITSLSNGVCKITFNRPAVYNSFNKSMALELQKELDRCAHDDEVRTVLLTGAGKAFCAGQDLAEATDPNGPELESIVRDHYNPIILKIRALEKPVIAAVNGVAAGAGANIALACDLTIATEQASFIQAFSKIGLAPDAGASWLLPARIGQARAMALALTGAPVTAEQAADWGMIWQCHDDAALMPAAEALVSQLAAGPTAAYAATKALVQDAAANSLSDQLDAEAAAQLLLMINERRRELLEQGRPL